MEACCWSKRFLVASVDRMSAREHIVLVIDAAAFSGRDITLGDVLDPSPILFSFVWFHFAGEPVQTSR